MDLATFFTDIDPQRLNYFFGASSSLATCLAAYLAYRSVKQVSKISDRQELNRVRQSTIEFVNNPESGLPALARVAAKEVDANLPIRACDEDLLKAQLKSSVEAGYIPEFSISDAEISMAAKHCRERIPLPYSGLLSPNITFFFNRLIAFRPYRDAAEPDKSITDLFNKIEDISNGVQHDIFDAEVLDRMYGGLMNACYRRHSDWMAWVKRKYGPRFYDQSEIIFDKLIWVNSPVYLLARRRVVLFLLSRVDLSAWRFVWRILVHRDVGRTYRDRKGLGRILERHAVDRHETAIRKRAYAPEVTFAQNTKLQRKQIKKLQRLFYAGVESSQGRWPRELSLERHDILGGVADWLSRSEKDWESFFIAERQIGYRKEIVGFIAIANSISDETDRAQWGAELARTIRSHCSDGQADLYKLLGEMGIPSLEQQDKKSDVIIDISALSPIKAHYVTSEVSSQRNNLPVGRTLLRKAIHHIRHELGKVPIVVVGADDEFGARAMRLYIGEGAHFVGTARDMGRQDGRPVHVFIF
ncbi:MAG: hypothetical protein Q8O19_05600 [Rectinemataceae bacterium]|nr:hypothetical protein [Rectinemataceae bacterium]